LRVLACLLLALSVPAPAVSANTPARTFSGTDLFKLSGATDPQVSPDGAKVAYVRMTADIMSDRAVPTIWLVDVASGRERPLVSGSASMPVWSPDGRRIAYVAGGDGKEGGSAQLHVLWLDSGADARLTQLPDSPDGLVWSPDGTRIAYTMRVPAEAATLGKSPDKPEGAKWADPLEVITRVTYRADEEGYLKPGFTHVFVVAADGGGSKQVTTGDFDDSGPLAWMPDGGAILFTANRRPDWEREFNNTEVYRVDLASGAVTALTSRNGPDGSPAVSPDGRHIAYLGSDDTNRSYEDTKLYVMNADGSGAHLVSGALDRSIEEAHWVGNGAVMVSYDDRAVRKVARIGLDGSVKPVAEGLTVGDEFDRPYTGGEFGVSANGTVAYTAGTPQRPADLWVTRGGQGRRLTGLNETWLSGEALAPVTKLAVTAPDGKPIDAWLVMPPDRQPGQRVPLILEIHGGPAAAYGPSFATDMQLYAAHGYAVLYANPRGSTSYGEDFALLIDRAYPGKDYDDLMAAVDAAIAAGVADPDNLFVTGGSGGGALTAWIVGKTNRFRAAAAQKPVVNWVSEALTMDSTTFTSRYWFDKKPWEDPTSYWKRSPLSLVGNVETPTLVVVGSEDYRTPDSEAEQLYAALQIRGVPTALVKVPGASHGGLAARPSQSAAKAAAILAWFDKYRLAPKKGAE
jgi:dipeptidyl aminopeptidase/acylaminoacyl peptidase